MNHITLRHIYLSHAFNTILKSKQVLTIQVSRKTITHHTALPSSSLRREALAYASRLRLGEGSKRGTIASHGISLKRDPSRLGEMLARSGAMWVAWAIGRVKQLGRAFVDLA